MFTPLLLALLACTSPEGTDTAVDEPGWVELVAESWSDADGEGPYWVADAPMEGPAPVQLWVTYGSGERSQSTQGTEWDGDELRTLATGGAVSAVYFVWVE